MTLRVLLIYQIRESSRNSLYQMWEQLWLTALLITPTWKKRLLMARKVHIMAPGRADRTTVAATLIAATQWLRMEAGASWSFRKNLGRLPAGSLNKEPAVLAPDP